MENFTVEMDAADYRLVLGDEEGPMVPYGQPATLVIDEAVYYCCIDDPDEQSPKVYRVDRVSVMPSDSEEVEFPPEVVAAARKLDEALEAQAAVIDATVDELAEGDEVDEGAAD